MHLLAKLRILALFCVCQLLAWLRKWFARTAAVCGVPAPTHTEQPLETTIVCARCGLAAGANCGHWGWTLWEQYPTPLQFLRREGIQTICYKSGKNVLVLEVAKQSLAVLTADGTKILGTETVSGYVVDWEQLAEQAAEIAADSTY